MRLTKQNGRESSAFSRGKEIELQNPIMQMMQMHEQQQKYRFSNISQSKSGQDGNNSIIFSDDSAMMMMVSDEQVFEN